MNYICIKEMPAYPNKLNKKFVMGKIYRFVRTDRIDVIYNIFDGDLLMSWISDKKVSEFFMSMRDIREERINELLK